MVLMETPLRRADSYQKKTIELLKRKNLDVDHYIRGKNSNVLLTKLHSTINTGYTGANFNDVYLFVRDE